jgi:glutamine---fructose-6-phosphate transaminase (isomerizing)
VTATPSPTVMRREIEEIPAVVARVLRESKADIERVATAIRAADPRWIMVAGRGTSDHAAVYAQYLFETYLGLPAGLVKPSVTTVYGASVAWAGGLVVAVSQSGRSPDVVAVVAEARRAGALTLAITNEPDSPLAQAAELRLDCAAGAELAVPATKTYVAELALLAALTAQLHGGTELSGGLTALPNALAAAIERTDAWLARGGEDAVASLAAAGCALVLSRGYNLATALELALKFKETCGLFAEGYSTADFAHGPLVLARNDVPVIVIRPDGEVGRQVDLTIDMVAARCGRTTVIGGSEVTGRDGAIAVTHELPEALTPLVYVVPGQILVEATAMRRGVSPDAPDGIQKVTLTR